MTNRLTYYRRRKLRFLWEFDLVAKSARSVLEKDFGTDARPMIVEIRREFESLIPQLPYIGGKQPFTEFIVFTAMFLALYRITKARGKTTKQTGEMMYEIGRVFLRSYPPFLKFMFRKMSFSRRYLNLLKAEAVESRRREYPEGYVINFIEGDGETFDYGVDYIECGSCKFLTKHDAPELASYLCTVDTLYSEALGWGLTRTQTLAEGADRCNFRFKFGGKTNVAVPETLREVVNKT